MKKIVTSFFIVTLIAICSIANVYAANLNASLSVQEVEAGKTFRISINSDSKLTDFEASVNNSNLGTPKVVSKYNGSIESTKGTKKIVYLFKLAAQAEKPVITSGANLVTFEYTVPANLATGSYNIAVDLKMQTENGAMLSESIIKTIKVVATKSTNANLSSITIDGKALTGFNKNTTSYTLDSVENNVTSITVGATVEDSKANVSGTGKINLNEGKNTITLKVTAESGAKKTYTLTVTRKEKVVEPVKSTNANLSSITIDGKALSGFNKNTTTYTLDSVENNVTSITVAAKVEDAKATVSGAGKINLKEGKNTITLNVTAESGATKTYTLTVTRKEKVVEPVKSTNANLSSITVDGKAISGFNKNTTTYTLDSVENNVTSITVAAKVEDAKATVSGAGKINLKEGKNTITLKVTAESGATKTYTLTVTRKAKEIESEVVKSSDNTLKTLKVDGKEIVLNNNKLEYTLKEVEYNTSTITITAIANHEKAVVEGAGTKELKVGNNKITLTVTAEDGTEQIYSVNIVRKAQEVTKPVVDEKDSNNINTTYIVIAITSVLILAVIIMFVISRRKNK